METRGRTGGRCVVVGGGRDDVLGSLKTKKKRKKDDLRRVAEIAGDVLKVPFSAGVGRRIS